MTYLEFAREHRRELTIMLDSISAMPGRDLDEDGLLGPSGVFGTIAEALADAARAGVIRASGPEELAVVFHGAWSLLHGIAVLEGIHSHHQALFGAHARSLVQAFLNGLATDWLEPTPSPAAPDLKERKDNR